MKFFTFLAALLIAVAASCQSKSAEAATVQHITTAEVEALQANGARLLDVRTPGEWSSGIIKGTAQINWQDENFAQKVQANFKKDEPIVVTCAVGGRSAKACDALAKLGYTKLYNLKGGMNAWTAEKRPVAAQ